MFSKHCRGWTISAACYTKWTDAAGVDRYGCEIIAEKVDFLSRPKAGEGEDPELVDREDQFAG